MANFTHSILNIFLTNYNKNDTLPTYSLHPSRSKKYSTNTDFVAPVKYDIYRDLTHYLKPAAFKMARDSSFPVVKLHCNLKIQERFYQNFRQAQ